MLGLLELKSTVSYGTSVILKMLLWPASQRTTCQMIICKACHVYRLSFLVNVCRDPEQHLLAGSGAAAMGPVGSTGHSLFKNHRCCAFIAEKEKYRVLECFRRDECARQLVLPRSTVC